jgi:hypothetical protein
LCGGWGSGGRLLRLGGLLGSSWLLGSLLLDSSRGLFRRRLLDFLWNLLSWCSGCNLLNRRLLLRSLMQLVVDLVEVLLAGRDLVALVQVGILRNGSSRGWLSDTVSGRGLLLLVVILLHGLVGKVTEDIVKDKVAVGLLGEDEGLDEALVGLALVGDFTNDLDDDVGVGALGVDVGDADLGVLEVELLDALVDGLYMRQLVLTANWACLTYFLA